jgi:hypothetical protein
LQKIALMPTEPMRTPDDPHSHPPEQDPPTNPPQVPEEDPPSRNPPIDEPPNAEKPPKKDPPPTDPPIQLPPEDETMIARRHDAGTKEIWRIKRPCTRAADLR